MEKNKRTNAGYEIIETISLPNEEYVLGVRNTTFNEQAYVTWVYVDGTYYYGHYPMTILPPTIPLLLKKLLIILLKNTNAAIFFFTVVLTLYPAHG